MCSLSRRFDIRPLSILKVDVELMVSVEMMCCFGLGICGRTVEIIRGRRCFVWDIWGRHGGSAHVGGARQAPRRVIEEFDRSQVGRLELPGVLRLKI
jgi:hypothetical protein